MQQYDGPLMDAHLLNPQVQLPSGNNQYDFQGIPLGQPNSDVYSVAQEDLTRVYDNTGFGLTINGPKTQVDLLSWDEVLEHCTSSAFPTPLQSSVSFGQTPNLAHLDFGEIYFDDLGALPVDATNAHLNSVSKLSSSDAVPTSTSNVDGPNDNIEQHINYPSLMKQLSLEFSNVEGERFRKHDSFSRWMTKELGEVEESNMNSSTSFSWNEIGAESVAENSSISNREHLDSYIMSPSLSQDQLFSITDFLPSWGYGDMETKVLISGTFLKNKEDIANCKWSCMFGEVEVPADVLADGVLQCLAPRHKAGRFPFYVTCSNRLACSEIREFEFRDGKAQQTADPYESSTYDMLLHIRLDNLLSLEPHDYEKLNSISLTERAHLSNRISSVMMEADDDRSILLKLSQESGVYHENDSEQILEGLLREKLHTWLLCRVAEDGKGPSVLDKDGQGVLHLAAALGYDWAIKPTVMSGVNINFRDAHGWTALHWAASFGRERTVVALITLGAAPGAVTDPTPDYPSGRTPADLASANGHKGIAGFLAESSLTSHLDALTLKEAAKGSGIAEPSVSTAVSDDFVGRSAIQLGDGDMEASLSAVRNASQAVARIYQVFRVQSFHRKKVGQYSDDQRGMSDERALSLISVKSSKTGQHDSPLHAAAVRIQNKFRGWKGRKDFLVIRQRIVKIQAHVRGHQVRKHYKKIVWTVGIVEKVILRWRRKGCGLRGFRSEGLLEGPTAPQSRSSNEDDYDFLQKGRRETEDRMQKALARVKSMVQYPEARDQYRRLLTVVTELQESKAMQENYMDESGDAADAGLMVELEELCDDETFLQGV